MQFVGATNCGENVMKNNIIVILSVFMIFIFGSCAKLKGDAKEIVSGKLHKYTTQAVSKLIKNGIGNYLPPEVAKLIPLLKKFGLKSDVASLDKTISKLTVKPVKVAEKIIHHAIDEMTLIDAIKLLTTSKSKSPMTKFLQNKTENIVNNQIKSELDKVLSGDSTINTLNKSIKMYSKLDKNVKQSNISDYVSGIATTELFKYISQAEKSDK